MSKFISSGWEQFKFKSLGMAQWRLAFIRQQIVQAGRKISQWNYFKLLHDSERSPTVKRQTRCIWGKNNTYFHTHFTL